MSVCVWVDWGEIYESFKFNWVDFFLKLHFFLMLQKFQKNLNKKVPQIFL